MQRRDGKLHLVAYTSRMLTLAESRYPITHLQCLALVYDISVSAIHLKSFTVVTYHHSLCYLDILKMNAHITGRITRWVLKMLEYTFDIKYTSGKSHAHVDSLSRNPVFPLPSDPSLVPLIQEIEKPSKVETKLSKLAKVFCLKGGVLYKINARPEDREKLLVIPDKLRAEIERTIDKIRRRYYWNGIFLNVEAYVRT
ncbi:hypothetical protein PR048_012973 [Dryococelus australis]|uniref:Reverse transcriptase RNase H-like domain-containing protein n=1 Tax=Dryococelus australis TaxID=614101 RepID=A0ABQ9HRQ0_9NEOP|nr:hypothetical protein PR048_012973 [Dryococelus australis]